MLNSIFLLSVAPARQIGYKLWNPEAGIAPDMYLLDGDSDSAVASWQATFASTSDRTLVVGSKNLDLGVASASRPLGLKVVGAMDRLAIALNNLAKQSEAGLDVSTPARGRFLAVGGLDRLAAQTGADPGARHHRHDFQQPAFSASMNAMAPMSAAARTMSGAANTLSPVASSTMSGAASSTLSPANTTMAAAANTMSATHVATHTGAVPGGMTAAAPANTVLPNVMLQPNVAPMIDKPFERTLNEKPVTDKSVDRMLSDKAPEKAAPSPLTMSLQASGVTPLSPSALSAAVASTRSNLRVVVPTPPAAASPLAASLPASARIADAPMQASLPAVAPMSSKLAEAPMQPLPTLQVTPPATGAGDADAHRARDSARHGTHGASGDHGDAARASDGAPRGAQLPRAGRGRQPADAHLPAEQAGAVRHHAGIRRVRRRSAVQDLQGSTTT